MNTIINKMSTKQQLFTIVMCIIGIIICWNIWNTPEPINNEGIPTATETIATTSASVTPAKPVAYPTETQGESITQEIYGFYRKCNHFENNPYLTICDDYDFTITITRENCNNDYCSATINYSSEYGDMWLDNFVTKTSTLIKDGDTVQLPNLASPDWSIGQLPFFEK